MEELCENPDVHNIQITFRMPNEILKHRINYKYMAIETNKHVKIMFDKLERILDGTSSNRHDRKASHQFEEVHDKFVVVSYPMKGYTVHAPPSNSFPPSHVSLFYAVYHCTQHRQAALAPTQIVEGHGSGGISLLCKNIQATPLLSTYPSMQRRTQKGGRSLPHMAATQSTIETKNNYHSILKCETRENT